MGMLALLEPPSVRSRARMAARKDTPAPVAESPATDAPIEEEIAVEVVVDEAPVPEETVAVEVVVPDAPVEDDVYSVDDLMPWPVATGTANTFGVDPGTLLGCPEPGSRDGAAAQVVRLLGLGDGIWFTQQVADAVAARQEAAGLEPTGVVDFHTWAHLLPELRVGSPVSPEVGLLRALLGLARAGEFDSEVEGLVRMVQAEAADDRTGIVGQPEWAALLGVAA